MASRICETELVKELAWKFSSRIWRDELVTALINGLFFSLPNSAAIIRNIKDVKSLSALRKASLFWYVLFINIFNVI